MFYTLRKKVLLRTVHWQVPWRTKNVSSMASLGKKTFGTFIFKSANTNVMRKYKQCFLKPVSFRSTVSLFICKTARDSLNPCFYFFSSTASVTYSICSLSWSVSVS